MQSNVRYFTIIPVQRHTSQSCHMLHRFSYYNARNSQTEMVAVYVFHRAVFLRMEYMETFEVYETEFNNSSCHWGSVLSARICTVWITPSFADVCSEAPVHIGYPDLLRGRSACFCIFLQTYGKILKQTAIRTRPKYFFIFFLHSLTLHSLYYF